MAKSNYIVPIELRHDYKMLVQRANRRVKANLKYIQTEDIRDSNTQRALVGSFGDPVKWAGGRMPYSRSVKGRYLWNPDTDSMEFKEFKNKREFDAYVRELEKFGKEGDAYERHPKQIIKDRKEKIIKSLNTIIDHYSIPLKNGQLPKEVLKALDTMTLNEATNFYSYYDIEEEIEKDNFDSDSYANVTNEQEFIDVTLSILGVTREMVKERTKSSKAKAKPRRRRKR